MEEAVIKITAVVNSPRSSDFQSRVVHIDLHFVYIEYPRLLFWSREGPKYQKFGNYFMEDLSLLSDLVS